MDQTFLVCGVFCFFFLVRIALQLSEMYDWEKWLYPLPAMMVSLSSLRAGSLEFF